MFRNRHDGRPICPTAGGIQDCSDPRCTCAVKRFSTAELAAAPVARKATINTGPRARLLGDTRPEPGDESVYDDSHADASKLPPTVQTATDTAASLRRIAEHIRKRIQHSEHRSARQALLQEAHSLEEQAETIDRIAQSILADVEILGPSTRPSLDGPSSRGPSPSMRPRPEK